MTENFTMGDYLQSQDTHCTSAAGNKLSTVLGIIGFIIVIALFWNAYTRARDTRANTEAIASGTLGNLMGTVNGQTEELRALKVFERQDALKIAHTDGVLFGDDCGCGYGYGHRGRRGHGCEDDCCGQRQQFREIRQFAETSDNIEVISSCGQRA